MPKSKPKLTKSRPPFVPVALEVCDPIGPMDGFQSYTLIDAENDIGTEIATTWEDHGDYARLFRYSPDMLKLLKRVRAYIPHSEGARGEIDWLIAQVETRS